MRSGALFLPDELNGISVRVGEGTEPFVERRRPEGLGDEFYYSFGLQIFIRFGNGVDVDVEHDAQRVLIFAVDLRVFAGP